VPFPTSKTPKSKSVNRSPGKREERKEMGWRGDTRTQGQNQEINLEGTGGTINKPLEKSPRRAQERDNKEQGKKRGMREG